MKFHWSLFDEQVDRCASTVEPSSPTGASACFSVEPQQGAFTRNEIKTFKVSFSSSEPTPVYAFASLIVDDISIHSIRNPPQSILSQIEGQHSADAAVPMKPGFVGSNSDR